jgi:hypothetical protein
VSCLLNGPHPGPKPGIRAPQTAADREGRSLLERVCGILTRSRLLYFAAVLALYPGLKNSSYAFDQWS